MLVESIVSSLPQRTLKTHHDRFVRSLYDALNHQTLTSYIQGLAHAYDVIFIDELQMRDVSEGIILLQACMQLVKNGVSLVLTGNDSLTQLKAQAHSNAQLMGLLSYMETHATAYLLEGEQDYRLLAPPPKHYYLMPQQPDFEALFQGKAHGYTQQPYTLSLYGRTWPLQRTAGSCVYLTFHEVCMEPRSMADYHTLLARFNTIFIEGVPALGEPNKDAARRFITLVDAVYDQKATLYLCANVPCEALLHDELASLPVARTRSRLYALTGG